MSSQQSIYEKKIAPIHPLTPEGEKYVASMTADQRKLHEIAIVSLASSYFVEKTHGFRAYLKGLDTKRK
jgi:hypothetical protein